ncbi:MAG: grasp-with-spasm system ATP-grasp peptide maturase [Bacteroidia bacterium]|nr:grasp-with-spasm system ATP-grasp peptide maturase [Bacteroidia bacterium]
MILLLTSSSDTNADLIIAWLKQRDVQYYRLNSDNLLDQYVYLDVHNNVLELHDGNLNLDEVTVVWYNKFYGFTKSEYFHTTESKVQPGDLQQLQREFSILQDFILRTLKNKTWMLSPFHASMNKLHNIRAAETAGLHTPRTHVVSTKKKLQELHNSSSLIIKSMYEPYFITNASGLYSMFTRKVKQEMIDKLPDSFFPSLVQEEVPKVFEIRTFYLHGSMYSMAIFSQASKFTQEDSRQVDWSNPNRRVPFMFPKDIEGKIHDLMNDLGLNYGTIDFIMSESDGEIYFLEINSTGQYGMISIPCNYTVYKDIANQLIHMHHGISG